MSDNPYQSPSDSGAPDYLHIPPSDRTNGLAIASLVCGIISLGAGFLTCCCGVLAILPVLPTAGAAILCGHLARGQIRRDGSQGAEMALGGLICGYVALGLAILAAIALGIMVIFSEELNL